MPLLIRRLEQKHLVESFDCGKAALNDYIKKYAWQNQVWHQVGVTYVATDESQEDLVIGYYTLASTRIPRDVLPSNRSTKWLPYEVVPALLLGKLAVDNRFTRRGVGPALLVDALNRSLELRGNIGCRYVIVDAYPDAVTWYAKYGFATILGEPPEAPTRQMFIDLRTVDKARQ